MDGSNRRLVIDAQHRGTRGFLAVDRLRGSSILDHLLHHAWATTGFDSITIHAPTEAHESLNAAIDQRFRSQVTLVSEQIPDNALALRTDRLYDRSRLKTAFRRSENVESAVIWRLDTEAGRLGAEDELHRRQSFQPLGRYWALAPARWLARTLSPTSIHPNHVTLSAAALMVVAASIVAFATPGVTTRIVTGFLLALALILDTADGHLARLQGKTSEFGRWLDSWLDEVCDNVLHFAIAWTAYSHTGSIGWLLLGTTYAMGKSIFTVGVNEWPNGLNSKDQSNAQSQPSILQATIRAIGHADLRWHLWIVFAILGQLPLALIFYAVYYPSRALLGAIRKGRCHA